MKILYLAHRMPYPPDKGDKIRSFHQLQYLGVRHDVWCACFVDDPKDMVHVGALGRWCKHVGAIRLSPKYGLFRGLARMAVGGSLSEGYYSDVRMRRLLRRWCGEVGFDAAVIFSSSMAPYRRVIEAGRMVLDLCDWDSFKWKSFARHSSGLRAWLYRVESGRVRASELRWLEAFDACTVVTEAEADEVTDPSLRRRLHVVGNGVAASPPASKPAGAAGPAVGFVGQMDYLPNVDAVRWFADNVWPEVRSQVPDATFEIVGRSPGRGVRELELREGIRVRGEVEDVRRHVEEFAVSVAPLRMGRGVQNKVLEAMAASRPVVVSSLAAAGIDAEDEKHFVVADDAAAISDRIVKLLRNPVRRSELGRAARRRIEERYSWDREVAKLEALLRG
ncbi:MAG: TIGR03087 family PEP-CTERM/XrtA system glycosyltransferase [Phycisphaerae bacterium]